MKKIILLAILSIFVFSGCFGGNDEKNWTALIYPDKENIKRSKKHGVYPTLKECQTASKLELKNLGLETRGAYKCGLNCEYHEGMKLDICEKLTD